MASYFEMAEGRMVHEKLRAAGGFVWDHRREGSQTISVHMNRGYAMTPELRAELKKHGKARPHLRLQPPRGVADGQGVGL